MFVEFFGDDFLHSDCVCPHSVEFRYATDLLFACEFGVHFLVGQISGWLLQNIVPDNAIESYLALPGWKGFARRYSTSLLGSEHLLDLLQCWEILFFAELCFDWKIERLCFTVGFWTPVPFQLRKERMGFDLFEMLIPWKTFMRIWVEEFGYKVKCVPRNCSLRLLKRIRS